MRVLTLLSGGLDSTTLLYKAIDSVGHNNVWTVSFNYGQRHKFELTRASELAFMNHVQNDIVDLTSLGQLFKGSALSDPEVTVPHGHYAKESMVATIVPNRNSIMLNCAVGIAISYGADEVWAAMHAGDHAIYPDCRPEFVEKLNELVGLANAWENPVPKVVAPFIGIPKDAIITIGVKLNVPWEFTWSCYEGNPPIHCGRCGTCVERQEAFHLAGVPDPTHYADSEFWKNEVGLA